MDPERDLMHSLEAVASIAIARNGEGKEYRSCRETSWKAYCNLKHCLGLPDQNYKELAADRIAKLLGNFHELEYIIIVLEEHLNSAVSLRDQYRRSLEPISASLSNGLKSLPDELLGLILQFAVPPRNGTKEAIRLSHVSCRFRNVALGVPKLWSTFSSEAHPEETKTLVSRCGRTSDLHIVISISDDGYDPERVAGFFNTCISTAARWVTLSFATELDYNEHTVDAVMSDIFTTFKLELPKLHTFEIRQHREDVVTGENSWGDLRFIPSWTTPNLRLLQCDEYLPITSSSYSSLKTFDVKLSLVHEEYPDLIAYFLVFLLITKSIEELVLRICSITNIMQPMAFNLVSCPSLTSLHLQLSSFMAPTGTCDLLMPIMEALDMPNLVDLSVCVQLRYESIVDEDDDTMILTELMLVSIPDRDSFSNLSSFRFELKLEPYEDEAWRSHKIYSKTMLVPLYRIPCVSDMTIISFSKIRFGWVNGVGSPASSLRRLNYHASSGMESVTEISEKEDDLKEFVQFLKDYEIWDGLERMKVDAVLRLCVEQEPSWGGKVVAKTLEEEIADMRKN